MTNVVTVQPFAGPRLPVALAKAVLPAYLLPAVQAGAVGLLTSNAELLQASYSTIAVPSAIAAAVVTAGTRLADRRQRRRPRGRTVGVLRATATGAVVGAAVIAATAVLLVVNGVFDGTLLPQAIPSGAVGGGVTALMWALQRNRRVRRQSSAGAARHLSASTAAEGTTWMRSVAGVR